ncbi:hypothetical protein K9B33_02030 [Sphingobium sp. 3R8]|uniref:hypothetical protein n=1 Tax=Sphingobium sp. 3R8 TaxID=2874921 RepID=UPI001CCF0042|nr:hypothetical protein [Sphingobium sp. 3R8]MBZ9646311.1 hypothetical protein [Sphingobium sp. 3R8]
MSADKGRFSGVSFPLAASSEMLFVDLPPLERVRRIDAAGFLVEIWDWTRYDIDALAASGATFSSMTGYVRGRLADRDGADELLTTARKSVAVAKRLGVPRLNLHGTGLGGDGLPPRPATEVTGVMWLQAGDTLCRPGRGSRRDLRAGESERRCRPSWRAVRQGSRMPGADRIRR